MKKFFQLVVIACGLATMNACNNQDACEDTDCQNGGICVEGDCVCPDGYSGPDCSITSFDNGVFVIHEGNFQGGNASLSFYNKSTGQMSNGVFSAVNGIPLGDVGQSMEIFVNKGYIAVNNSGKVEVVNLSDLTSIGTITGLSSPRYVKVLNASLGYITDLFSGQITVFNPSTLEVTGTIDVNGHVEQVVNTLYGLIATGTAANQVYKINATTNEVTDSVYVGIGPSNMVLDFEGKVWILTNGGWGVEEPKLVHLNPNTMQIEESFGFPSINNYPGNLEINGDGTELYYVDGMVYKMSVFDNALPTMPFSSSFAYKCGVDPLEDIVYISDAGDFNSNGKVYRFESDGTAIDTFDVGVIPAEYAFTE